MEVLVFTVINKEIECDTKQVVGDNDYQASFLLDEEWNDKEVICRVVWNNKTSLDIKVEDLSCIIPAYIMKRGEVSIGVYAENDEQLTTEPWVIGVKKSIREKEFETAVPHKAVWDGINEKVKDVVTHGEFDEQVGAKINAYLAKNGISGEWTKDMCPNLYVFSNGTVQANGTKRDYNNTISVLKTLGVKQVSLLAMIATCTDNVFALDTNVNYTDVIKVVHDNGMTVKSVRFSNTAYGKDKMCSSTALVNLANSIPKLLDNLGIRNEVEFVGILNETSQAYFDSTLTDAIVSCILSLQANGLKVAITDNARYCMQIPDAIINALDYIGFNEYPILCAFEGKATADSVAKAFDSYQIAMYADKLKAKGIKVYISEVGCVNQANALRAPSEGTMGEYNGMTNILLEFKGFKKYLNDSDLGNLIETFNPWYTELWEITDEMIELFGGAK